MRPLHASVLAVHSTPRQQIYSTLLAQPERMWTVRELTAALPDVSVEAVTATLYQLLNERLLDQVRRTSGLTLRLNSEGHAAIVRVAHGWTITSRQARP